MSLRSQQMRFVEKGGFSSCSEDFYHILSIITFTCHGTVNVVVFFNLQ